jgi:hypothetical protein
LRRFPDGPPPRFRFEAKRLRDATSRLEYLGGERLGCYLVFRYARDDRIAGMLRHIHAGTIDLHADAIRDLLAERPTTYAVEDGGQWTKFRSPASLSTGALSAISILHTLLIFC